MLISLYKEAGAVFVAIAIIVVVALFVLLFLNSDRGSGDSEFKNKNYWQDGADNYWEPSSPWHSVTMRYLSSISLGLIVLRRWPVRRRQPLPLAPCIPKKKW